MGVLLMALWGSACRDDALDVDGLAGIDGQVFGEKLSVADDEGRLLHDAEALEKLADVLRPLDGADASLGDEADGDGLLGAGRGVCLVVHGMPLPRAGGGRDILFESLRRGFFGWLPCPAPA